MSPSALFLLVGILTAVALQLAADYGPARLRPWARGSLLWSGMLWTGFVLAAFVALVSRGGGWESEEPMRYAGGLTWMALLLGSGFFVAGNAVRVLGRLRWMPRWVVHAVTLLSAVPGVLAGYVAYRILMLAFFDEALFWKQPDSIARIFDTVTLWLLSNAAIVAGLVRMLYDLRTDAADARRQRLEADLTTARRAALETRLRPHALLNALSGLAGLIRTDAASAEAMTLALARLLRRTLATSDAPTVALADEIALASD